MLIVLRQPHGKVMPARCKLLCVQVQGTGSGSRAVWGCRDAHLGIASLRAPASPGCVLWSSLWGGNEEQRAWGADNGIELCAVRIATGLGRLSLSDLCTQCARLVRVLA